MVECAHEHYKHKGEEKMYRYELYDPACKEEGEKDLITVNRSNPIHQGDLIYDGERFYRAKEVVHKLATTNKPKESTVVMMERYDPEKSRIQAESPIP